MRGGPSLSLSLDCAETILVIDGHLHWCGPNAVGSLGALPGLWAVLGLFFLCPGCGLVVLVLFAYPGLWGFAWLFCWLCLYVGVGFCCSVLFGCLCWLYPYVGDWLMFIRCILFSG